MEILFKKINSFLEKYYKWILGLILVLLLFFNAFIYYNYVYLATKTEVSATVEKISVNEKVLNKVLEEIRIKEEALIRIETETYFDPFN